ncbi:PAS domain S-box protein [Desulfolutivibrio sulfoxidireducens]|uniref:PAS domain S-box protein n=1 Tax=Desulfolutivibrio sulfoxidireducens TaxID=2773299 RepID=UPI00159DC7B6|nr:PAS domain S-box protein [Desulfolutivibrio sulfoxidireducens]
MRTPGYRYVLTIPAIYLLAAGAWILFSDMAVTALFPDPETAASMQTYKGWFFVAATTLLLYALLRRVAARQQADLAGLDAAKREVTAAGDRLASVIRASPLAIFILDRQGRVTLWSPAAERLFGWSEAEVLGRVLPTVPASMRAEFETGLTRAFSGEPISGLEAARMRRDGSMVEISLNTAPLFDGASGVAAILVMASDVSAARGMARERDLFFNNSIDLLCVTDFAGILQQANPAWTHTLGYPPEELAGRPWIEFVHPDDVTATIAMGERLVEGSSVRNFEVRLHRKDGASRWLSFTSHPIPEEQRIFSVARDISDRKQAEEELLKRRRFVETVLRNIPIGVCVRTLDTGRATFHNPRYTDILGWPLDTLITPEGSFERLFPDPDIRALHATRMAADIQSGDPARMFWKDVPIVTARGERRHVTMASFPVPDQNVLVTTVQDTTFRKVAETTLAQAKKEAEQANQAKTQFLANMSHELRTPLNAIFGMAQLAQHETLSTEQAECWDITFQSAKRLLAIVDNLLELANLESGAVQMAVKEFDVRALIDSLCRTHAVQARLKGLSFSCVVEDDVAHILLGDPFRLRQILLNLLSNSIRFTSRGIIELRVSRYQEPPEGPRRVFVEPGFSGECLLFQVTDSGIGIPRDKQDAIFDSFSLAEEYLTKKYGGTGLGLSIAKQLAELLGGTVWVQSEPGQGSVFSFTAAFWLPARLAETPLDDLASPLPPRSLRVLLAEDEESNRISAGTMLRRHGHTVTSVGNGQEALRALSAAPYDVVLMDIQMPVMDGLAATRHIRGGEIPGGVKTIPIIALTAYAMEADRERFLSAGMDDFVAKPFEMRTLLDTVDRVMARKRLN